MRPATLCWRFVAVELRPALFYTVSRIDVHERYFVSSLRQRFAKPSPLFFGKPGDPSHLMSDREYRHLYLAQSLSQLTTCPYVYFSPTDTRNQFFQHVGVFYTNMCSPLQIRLTRHTADFCRLNLFCAIRLLWWLCNTPDHFRWD